jgi:hypothetical protein
VKGKKPGEMAPETILALREGYTVADASNVFDASFQRNPKLIECGCNMHARRYYVKALDAGDQRAALPLAAYKRLYEIEEEIRQCDPDAKLAVRQAQSKPVFNELVAWAKTPPILRAANEQVWCSDSLLIQSPCRTRALS